MSAETATDRARRLLLKVNDVDCSHETRRGDFPRCVPCVNRRANAYRYMTYLGFNPQSLSAAVASMEALDELQEVMNQSKGVIGWHLNGETAEWDGFDFEEKVGLALKEYERLFPPPP